jgi:hypothetical protein
VIRQGGGWWSLRIGVVVGIDKLIGDRVGNG